MFKDYSVPEKTGFIEMTQMCQAIGKYFQYFWVRVSISLSTSQEEWEEQWLEVFAFKIMFNVGLFVLRYRLHRPQQHDNEPPH